MLADLNAFRSKLPLLSFFSPGVPSKPQNWAKQTDSKAPDIELKSQPPVEKMFGSSQWCPKLSFSRFWTWIWLDSIEWQVISKTIFPRKLLKIEVIIYKNPQIKKKCEFWFLCSSTAWRGFTKPLKELCNRVLKLLFVNLFSKRTRSHEDRGSDWRSSGKMELSH